jgi:hypothetical protein
MFSKPVFFLKNGFLAPAADCGTRPVGELPGRDRSKPPLSPKKPGCDSLGALRSDVHQALENGTMPLTKHPLGNYLFLPGIAPYSCGVISASGYEIVHATCHRPIPYREGFARIERHLASENRPRTALCAMELRSPAPFSFDGFAAFNAGYAEILRSWNLFVDGINPVARTNVAPEIDPRLSEPMLYGFSYTRPCDPAESPTFVVAGAGELPEGILTADAIVRGGETTPDAITQKAEFVMDLMANRLHGLGADWSMITAVDVYTVHPIHPLLPALLVDRVGPAAVHGLRWFYSRPPIVGIEYEMDLRGVRTEVRVG